MKCDNDEIASSRSQQVDKNGTLMKWQVDKTTD
jgi:hypothetical protein